MSIETFDSGKEQPLVIPSKVTTRLAGEKTAKLAATAAAAEKTAQARRDKATQQLSARATKKNLEQAAKDCDLAVSKACDDLESAISGRAGTGVLARRLREEQKYAAKMERKADAAKAEAQKATEAVRDTQLLLDGDNTGILAKSQKLREEFLNANEAWGRIQTAIRKRDRDRATKKRAKRLLD